MINQIPTFVHPHTGLLDPEGLLSGFGSLALVAACAILFIECGLLVGVVLPGDSLLFIVGVFLASGFIATPVLIAITALVVSSIAGNLIGYWVGEKVGPSLFRRPDSKLFKQEYVTKTSAFFEKHGSRAIILARFVPVVRSVITAMAGIGRMEFRRYAIYSTIGGIAWVLTMTFAGYFLGNVTFIKEHIDLVTLAIVAISLIPVAIEVARHKRS